jgi:hypothetical protein
MVANGSLAFRERFLEKSKRAVSIVGDGAPEVAMRRMHRELREIDQIAALAALPPVGGE